MKFTSVSEATSIINSANVSAYDITIDGNRGHSAIRSAGSSRVFIGKVTDRTDGLLIDDRNTREEGVGQYHACGVSKPSMGALGERRLLRVSCHTTSCHIDRCL